MQEKPDRVKDKTSRKKRLQPNKSWVTATAFSLLLVLSTAPAAQADHEYEQPVWFNWDKTELDVLVVGVDDPVVFDAILDAIESWEEGIDELAPLWLAESFQLNLWVPAQDGPIPPAGFKADIAVAPQGFFAINAEILYQFEAARCYAFAPMLAGWGSYYHTALHEFGHCLGLDHVFNHGDEYSPAIDPLGGGQAGHRSCPSNLNIQVLERVFSGGTGTVTIASSVYYQSEC